MIFGYVVMGGNELYDGHAYQWQTSVGTNFGSVG